MWQDLTHTQRTILVAFPRVTMNHRTNRLQYKEEKLASRCQIFSNRLSPSYWLQWCKFQLRTIGLSMMSRIVQFIIIYRLSDFFFAIFGIYLDCARVAGFFNKLSLCGFLQGLTCIHQPSRKLKAKPTRESNSNSNPYPLLSSNNYHLFTGARYTATRDILLPLLPVALSDEPEFTSGGIRATAWHVEPRMTLIMWNC